MMRSPVDHVIQFLDAEINGRRNLIEAMAPGVVLPSARQILRLPAGEELPAHALPADDPARKAVLRLVRELRMYELTAMLAVAVNLDQWETIERLKESVLKPPTRATHAEMMEALK